jgi:hypothetical protein
LLGPFVQPEPLTPGGPQGLNRYSYSINNPTNYTDPSGNMPTQGCGDDGKSACAPTQQETDQNAAKLVLIQAKAEDHECKAGNEIYCPTVKKHPAEVATFVITGLVGAAALPEAWAITEAVGWNVAEACATSIICWTVIGAGGVGAAGAVGVGSNQIGRNGVNQVLRTLNDPNALTEQTVTGNGLSGRIDILTNTAMNEVKNVANLSLSQRFMEQAYRYSEIAQANELELHYWLVNDHPQYIVDWLSRLGIIVH